jgi:hypothetical protein
MLLTPLWGADAGILAMLDAAFPEAWKARRTADKPAVLDHARKKV